MPIAVSLSAPTTTSVTITYRLTPLTASGGVLTNPANDVDHLGGILLTLEIPAGSVQRSIIVSVGSDLVREGTETYQVTIETVTGAALLNTTTSSQILDDD
jgi:hypothetical protein